MSIADAPFVGVAVPVKFSPISKAYWQTDASVKEIALRFSLKSDKQVLKRAGPAVLRNIACRHCSVDLEVKNRAHAISEMKCFEKSTPRYNKVECYPCFRKVRDDRLKARWSGRAEIEPSQQVTKTVKTQKRERPTRGAPSSAQKNAFYASWDWRTLRMEIIKEFGRACQCCGAAPGMKYASGEPVRICVDHIKPISKFWELRLVKSNMQILCDECNQGKGNWDQTDFRPAAAPDAPDEWIVEDEGFDPLIVAQLAGGRLQ